MSEIKKYKCRVPSCPNPAVDKYPCCSTECRKKVPNCNVYECRNAVEPCIYKGIDIWSEKCYIHGGRVEFDGDVSLLCQRTPIVFSNKSPGRIPKSKY